MSDIWSSENEVSNRKISISADMAGGESDFRSLMIGNFDPTPSQEMCNPCNEPLLPIARRVSAQLLATEIVSVKPMKSPWEYSDGKIVKARLPRKIKKQLKSAFGKKAYRMWVNRSGFCNSPIGSLMYVDYKIEW